MNLATAEKVRKSAKAAVFATASAHTDVLDC
ncbi:hypothetical protein SAMN05421757_1255 [Tropicimonas sediminicola]|uniref:Uncharacterized protein n=1 Tax=Tropicimonas sediminicola TaxID=1031541 RepID=A0A239ML48_9RHOB|nr:hypothetical protein SAMN05421757_1255 [Tropicimonas sediminicola]